jgi:SAM-dependent methyltransferase
VSTQVFEHLAYPQKGAAEMYRVLKPGGYALVTVPQWNELHEEPHDYFRYTNYGLETLFAEAGFKVVSMSQVGGYYSTLAQMRIRFAIDKYNLYNRPVAGRVAGKLLAWYGRHLLAKDRRDTSAANRKHAIGWCVVLQK